MDHSVSSGLRIGAIIQARMGSSRLPGKVLLPLPLNSQTTVIDHVLSRAFSAKKLHTVIVATSDSAGDDVLAAAVRKRGIPVYRGSEKDVLERFVGAAAAHQLDVIVRLTADNPAIDSAYIDLTVKYHLSNQADYTITRGLPLGTNLEIISRDALIQAHTYALNVDEREHVTPYMRRNPGRFRIINLNISCPTAVASCRLTLDYPSDYAFTHLLYTQLPEHFTLEHVSNLIQHYPWLGRINAGNEQIKT